MTLLPGRGITASLIAFDQFFPALQKACNSGKVWLKIEKEVSQNV